MFVLVAALVVGGLGWVTVASLRVETAEREATARADRLNKERLALWRLDGQMLPVLALEGNRPFAHYVALNAAYPAVNLDFDEPAQGVVRLPSPLLSAELPDWMLLHFQLDPEAGWQSPQVIPADLVERLQAEPLNLSLANVTPERERLLAELGTKFPAAVVAKTLGERERASPDDNPFVIPHRTLEETAAVKPAGTNGTEAEVLNRAPADAPADPANDDRNLFRYVAPPAGGSAPAPGKPPALPTPGLAPATPVPPAAQPPAPVVTLNLAPNPPQQALGAVAADPGPQAANAPASNFNGYAMNNSDKAFKQQADVQTKNEQELRYQLYQRVLGMGRGGNEPQGNFLKNSAQPQAPANGADAANAGEKLAEAKSKAEAQQRGMAMKGASDGVQSGVAAADARRDTDKLDAAKDAKLRSRGEDETAKKLQEPSALSRKQEPKPEDAARRKEQVERLAMLEAEKRVGGASGLGGGVKPLADREGDALAKPTTVAPMAAPRPTAKPMAAAAAPEAIMGRTALAPASGPAMMKAAPAPSEPQRAAVFDAPAGVRKPAPAVRPAAVHLGPLRPQWLAAADGSEILVLVRSARLEEKTVYQGVVLDWPRLQSALGQQVSDLFPAAKLTPVRTSEATAPERAMTALPALLDTGTGPDPVPAGWSPLRTGLVIAWVAAVVALAAVGVGGASLVSLSERRIRFVSAVTHELRTPLTSLRLYLDLLASGMVTDEQKQKEYIATLATESERLHRLIENVLDFARLEKNSVKTHTVPVAVSALLDELRTTWTDRCAADGKELTVVSTVPAERKVSTDPRMAAQVIGNLVDNARKYTRDAADGRIWVWAKPGDRGRVAFEVEDRGPGVPTRDRRGLFRPFRRGSAADTQAGGAGLGLALAKQWAEALGGRLTYRPAEGGVGACFRLELPGAEG